MDEPFEDSAFASRGWYDGSGFVLSSAEHLPGSAKSAEFHWAKGATKPAVGGALRRKFAPSDSVAVSYWVKYSANYTGSNKPYHPHEFNLLTTKNNDYVGPAYTHLTGYIEQNEGTPRLSLQDGQNIDETRIGQNLNGVTENRAVAGCNGNLPDGSSSVDCYLSGSVHWNGRSWNAARVYFQDSAGPNYKADWHHVEAFFQMNSLSNGKGVADGQLKYWYDGELIIDHTNVLMRTGANADMQWNQLLVAPYIGDGSPIDQTMWVDNLRITTARVIEDRDHDGLPDDWELRHGLDPSDPSDATDDADADGAGNLEEYRAGTDPHDPQNVFRIVQANLDGTDCVIRFNTVAGKRYQLERVGNLAGNPWQTVGAEIAGTGAPISITGPKVATGSSTYYRLKLE